MASSTSSPENNVQPFLFEYTKHQQVQLGERERLIDAVQKLKNELDRRQQELATHVELLIYSGSVNEKLVGRMNSLQPYLSEEGRSKLNSVVREVKWELNDEVRLNFEKKFDQLNSNLYSLLEQKFPDITKNEKRLCALLQFNHSAADIAKITDKSLNCINVAFARLRFKLGLPNNKALKEVIVGFLKEISTTRNFNYP